jgi:glycine/serine hydroxymethyltransferase
MLHTGTPAMTTRGCLEDDFEVIADFLIRATQIASNLMKEHGKMQKEFLRGLQNNKDIIFINGSNKIHYLSFSTLSQTDPN